MQQNFDKLKEFFENYDEQNLRSLEDEVLSSHMEHYKRRLVSQFDVILRKKIDQQTKI